MLWHCVVNMLFKVDVKMVNVHLLSLQ